MEKKTYLVTVPKKSESKTVLLTVTAVISLIALLTVFTVGILRVKTNNGIVTQSEYYSNCDINVTSPKGVSNMINGNCYLDSNGLVFVGSKPRNNINYALIVGSGLFTIVIIGLIVVYCKKENKEPKERTNSVDTFVASPQLKPLHLDSASVIEINDDGIKEVNNHGMISPQSSRMKTPPVSPVKKWSFTNWRKK